MLANTKITIGNFYFTCLILLTMSLPLSKYTTGLFQFLLIFIWSLWGVKKAESTSAKSFIFDVWTSFRNNLIQKLDLFWKNKPALLISSLFLIYLTGLFRAGDFSYVLSDLRVKLPLLILPLVIAGLPRLRKDQHKILLLFYVGAVLIGTGFSAYELYSQRFSDIREISVFISPVRFGLNICLAIVILFGFVVQNIFPPKSIKIAFTLLILWLLFILFKLESGISVLILGALGLIFILKQFIDAKSLALKMGVAILLISGVFFSWNFLQSEIKGFYATPKINPNQLDKKTNSGNEYVHDTINYLIEDGKFIGLHLCEKELKDSWNKRSSIGYDGVDKKGQALRSTLIRFLTSKNLRKDKEGLLKLTDDEIKFIENGIANSNYVNRTGLRSRISKILFGYQVYLKTNDPGTNSLTKRFEHWKASVGIIKDNFWLGVGTGNIPQAFDQQYDAMASKLAPDKRMESHNQYLHVLLNLGVFGFLWFLFALLYPGIKSKKIFQFNYLAFLVIILISMLTEDTMETQSGVTFFAFFNSLFLLRSSD